MAAETIHSRSADTACQSGKSGNVAVKIAINGQALGTNILVKPASVYSYTLTFTTPTELAKNDRINFQTHTGTVDAINTIVSLLIELDL